MSTQVLPWHQRIIGELDGHPLIGTYQSEDRCALYFGRPEGVRWEWDEIGTIGIDLDEAGAVKWVHLDIGPELDPDEYAELQALLSGGILDRLTAIARQHCASPPLPFDTGSVEYFQHLALRGLVVAKPDDVLVMDVCEVLDLLPLLLSTDDDELIKVLCAEFMATSDAAREAAGPVLRAMHELAAADGMFGPPEPASDQEPDLSTDDPIARMLRRALGE